MTRICRLCALIVLSSTLAHPQALPVEPLHDSGQSVTGAFEGWFQNQDGTFNFLLGYYNRNHSQELDIPIGPNNRIEPGGPDQGQPTHFLSSRQWGVFTVTVPHDFGTKKLTWTLVVNGKTTAIPMSLDALWEIQPFKEASGNTPPAVRLDEGGSVQGPRPLIAARTLALPNPLLLNVWVSDDAKLIPGMPRPNSPPVILTWSKFRGPGTVAFASEQPRIDTSEGQRSAAAFSGKASTTATFSDPGEYVLLVQANDWTGRGGAGFQCCWTNAQVKVSIAPAAGTR
jgi:hypothetical protein